MNLLNQIKLWIQGITGIVMSLFAIAIFSELLFGQFLGNFSVLTNFINIVGQFGAKGFVGLLALLLVLYFIDKGQGQNPSAPA